MELKIFFLWQSNMRWTALLGNTVQRLEKELNNVSCTAVRAQVLKSLSQQHDHFFIPTVEVI